MSGPHTIEPSGRTKPCAEGCRHPTCVALAEADAERNARADRAEAALARATERGERMAAFVRSVAEWRASGGDPYEECALCMGELQDEARDVLAEDARDAEVKP